MLSYQTSEPQKGLYNKFLDRCSEDVEGGYTFKQLVVPQTELIQKATQLTASGDAPAMILADNNNVPTLADAGVLAQFDVNDSGLSESDFEQGPLESGSYDGTQYGLPVGNNGEVIVYDKDALAAAGVTPPKSWQELKDAARALTADGKYGWGVSFNAGEVLTWNWVGQLWSNGGSLTDLTSPESVEATEFWTSFILDGTAPQASIGWESADLQGQFTGKQIPMVQVGTWVLPGLLADAEKAGINVGIAPQVSADGGPPNVPFGGEILALSSGATGDVAKAASECLGLFFSDVDTLIEFDSALGYVPAYKPAQEGFIENNPDLQVMADQLATARARTEEVGPQYAAISTAMSTALQAVASGSASVEDALATAQQAAQQ
jgi:multiple sugar transport system substrate-binding protein